MQLRNLHLFPANISKLGRTGHLEAVGVSIGRKRNEQGAWTREPENYIVECNTFHGDILKVKVPLSTLEKFQKLEKIVKGGNTAEVSFTGLTIRPYAMTTGTGAFLSGVSAKAEDFEIVKILDDDTEYDMENISIEE